VTIPTVQSAPSSKKSETKSRFLPRPLYLGDRWNHADACRRANDWGPSLWESERPHCGVRFAESPPANCGLHVPVTRELPEPVREELPSVEDLQEVVSKLKSEMETFRREPPDEK
jgi:hypothetical protein